MPAWVLTGPELAGRHPQACGAGQMAPFMMRECMVENGKEKEVVRSRLMWEGCYPPWAMVSMSWATSVAFPEFLYMVPFYSGHRDDGFNYIKSCITHCSKDRISTDWREWGWESASLSLWPPTVTSTCPAPAWWHYPLSLLCLCVLVTTPSLYPLGLKSRIACTTSPRSCKSLLWLFSPLCLDICK